MEKQVTKTGESNYRVWFENYHNWALPVAASNLQYEADSFCKENYKNIYDILTPAERVAMLAVECIFYTYSENAAMVEFIKYISDCMGVDFEVGGSIFRRATLIGYLPDSINDKCFYGSVVFDNTQCRLTFE